MFIVSPRVGLCNQLQTIIKGILLGIKYNRNIYIDKFQIDLKSGRLCDINDILDINRINNFLKNTIKTSILVLNKIEDNITKNLQNYFIPNIDYTSIAYKNYLNDVIESNATMEIIYLGNIVSLDIYSSFNCNHNDYSENNLYYLVMRNIYFREIFYELKDNIKQILGLTQFNSVHLRIEDDALNHFSSCYKLSVDEYNKKLLDFYNKNIDLLRENTEIQKKIYICSGILDFDNRINLEYYEKMMESDKLLCDKKNINIDSYYLKNRELIAIIDLLIAYDSDYFIGSQISSFSIAIQGYFKNKNCVLFKL